MKRMIIAAAVLATAGCLETKQDEIIVDGAAQIEVMPDSFVIAAQINTIDDERAMVLRNLAETAEAIIEKTPGLEGLEAVKITAGSANVAARPDPDCAAANEYNAEDICELKGYRGDIQIVIAGAPVEMAGAVLSFAVELGATDARLASWRVQDRASHEQRALAAAIAKAQYTANSIASASGLEIGGVTTIQYGDGFRVRFGDELREQAFGDGEYTGPIYAMAQSPILPLTPDPIIITSRVTAAFAVKPKPAPAESE